MDGRIDKGDRQLLARIPPHKTLLHAPHGVGLPVGNLTSQFFANVYLKELDQYCKHTLKCRYYVRYCDDFLILDNDPKRLEEIREDVRIFLAKRLRGVVASYRGHFKWGDTHRLRRSIFRRYPWLNALYRQDGDVMPKLRNSPLF